MSSVTVSSILGDIQAYRFNPVMLQRSSLSVLRAIMDGTVDIVDGSNPFVYALEATSVNTAAVMQQMEALTRRQYPVSALTADDLYLHMSDKDYVDRFAIPTTAKIHLLVNKQELLQSLVFDSVTGANKLIIPRNTYFTVADVVFSIQYPIEIKQLQHGGLQASYIVDKLSPLKTLQTNIVEFTSFKESNQIEYLDFVIDVDQFSIVTINQDVNASSGLSTDVSIDDSFYYARVYNKNSAGVWVELTTTYTEQIYDPAVPTAVIKVIDRKVNVTIPVVYVTNGTIRGKIRIDIYQTRGQFNILLTNYGFTDFVATWRNVDSNDDNVFTVPIKKLKTALMYSTSSVTGGRAELTVDQLRDRIINNTVGQQIIPITPARLQSNLLDSGYELVKNIDTLTGRVFLATRQIPNPIDSRILTPAASSMSTVILSMKEASTAAGVIDNINSITLTSKTIYQNNNGITRVISSSDYNNLINLPAAQRCEVVTAGGYFYSPFYYVLDSTSDLFELRPYHLDTPSIFSKSFIKDNSVPGFQVSIDSAYSIVKNDTGYLLTVVTQSSDNFKALDDDNIYAQLSFIPSGEIVRCYLLGTLTGLNSNNERIYTFNITSSHYIDSDGNIGLTSFKLYTDSLTVKSKLVQDIDLCFSVKNVDNLSWGNSSIDNILGMFQLPSNVVGISQETLSMQFGYSLETLWSKSRSVVSSVPYKVYSVDVPDTYTERVYNKDVITGAIFTVSNGQLVYNVLHEIGAPKLDNAGNQIFLHRAGDPILDASGNPTPMDNYTREMIRQIDVFMLDGIYYFATNKSVIDYKDYAVSTLVQWLSTGLINITDNLLELTKIFFYPKTTQGNVKITANTGLEQVISAGQSFVVTLYITDTVYKNVDLINSLTSTTIKTIDKWLQNSTVSISTVIASLRSVYGGDVISVTVEGLGGSSNYDTVFLTDEASRLSIKKKLSLLGDGKLTVEEDVKINFIIHDSV